MRFRQLPSCNTSNRLLNNPRLLPRDLLPRTPQYPRVLQPDVRDHAQVRLNDVRGVEPTTESGLQDDHVAPGGAEVHEREHRRYLEERRGYGVLLAEVEDSGEEGDDGGRGNRDSVHHHALAEGGDVGGDEEAGF